MKKHCDILLKNARYLDAEMNIIQGKDIIIRDKMILEIADAGDSYTAGTTLDGGSLLWMPGLTDGHVHTSQQLLRGRLLDEKPVIWKRVNVPFESRLTEETSRLSAEIAALEMIKNGTTAFVDAGGKDVETFADVYEQAGLRARLTYMTNDNPFAPDSLRVTPQEGLDRLIRLREHYNDGRIQAYFSVTALTAASEELIRLVFSEAKRRKIPTEVHMNEYASEVYDFIEKYGVRPFEFMEQEGLMSECFIAAHCIFLSESEIDILQRYHVRVVHCPFSNCGKGVPATPQLLGRNVSVGFGSDGSAHGGLDLFKEIRLFRGVMNAYHSVRMADPQVMPAETLLKMATIGGAATMMTEGLARVAIGCRADLIAIDLNQPHLFPTQNLVHTLIESATGNDVAHMIVDGKLLMKNRCVLSLDEEKILFNAQRMIADNHLFTL